MNNNYEKPVIDVTEFEVEDILTSSTLQTADFEGAYTQWDMLGMQ